MHVYNNTWPYIYICIQVWLFGGIHSGSHFLFWFFRFFVGDLCVIIAVGDDKIPSRTLCLFLARVALLYDWFLKEIMSYCTDIVYRAKCNMVDWLIQKESLQTCPPTQHIGIYVYRSEAKGIIIRRGRIDNRELYISKRKMLEDEEDIITG